MPAFPFCYTNRMRRLDDLKRKLKGSMDRNGDPHPGYEERAAAIKAEIARLSA